MKHRLAFLGLGVLLALASCSAILPSSSSVSSVSSEESGASSESSESSSSASTSPSSSQSSSSSSSQTSSTSSSSSSSTVSYSSVPVPEIETDPRWNVDFTQRGRDFMVTLSKLILASGKTASKGAAISIGAQAAAYPNANSSTFIPFYRAPSTDNLATQGECNREHTWPDSRGGSMFENDPVMLRPTFEKDNSDRGNFFYGVGGKDNREWDPATFGYEAARGESARVILYCATAYYAKGISLSNNPRDASGDYTMGTLKTLLQWNRDYPPTDFEKLVNDRYDDMGYRRNPFVDHPGYAEYIYDGDGIRSSESTEWHEQVKQADSLDGKQFIIASQDPKDSSNSYYMMADKAKGASIPWYISPIAVRYENGKISMDRDPVYYTFRASGSSYYISNSIGQKLYAYVSGTYSSICLGDAQADVTEHSPNATDISDLWNVTFKNGFVDIASANGKVYLECFNGSFCGFSREPSTKPMLFA